jgi:regulation of enolase protein 1 (concanavalin A-like superfamily)
MMAPKHPEQFRYILKFFTFVLVFFAPLATTLAAYSAEKHTINAAQSDDFNQNNLDSRWTFIDPNGKGTVAITDVGGDAHLELNVPAGEEYHPNDTNTALRVMQSAANTDFSVEARFGSVPSTYIQMQGFIIEQDDDNWLRFDNHFQDNEIKLYAASTAAGDSTTRLFETIEITGTAIILRVTRTGDLWNYAYSENGTNWYSPGVDFSETITVSNIGLFAGNFPEGSSPQFTSKIDYFEISADPLAAEDGAARTDTQAPLIHTISYTTTLVTLNVNWFTDEPAAGYVEYGLDATYGSTQADLGGSNYFHTAQITGLIPGQTYHFRACAEDGGARSACSADFETTLTGSAPIINLWYGDEQNFGANGQTQPWVNLLGNVTDLDGVSDMHYSLNSSSPVTLTLGKDYRRLENWRDFNIDISTADLLEGENQVVITAQDLLGNTAEVTATVNYTSTTLWPSPYAIDWSTLASDDEIQDVAQVVDGKWTLVPGGVRTAEPGYDRLIALGDRTWTDYEATVPLTMHSMPDSFGVGLLFRWDGHTDDPVVCDQPKCGYFPLGAIGWLNDGKINFWGPPPSTQKTWELDTTYIFKMRVETTGGITSTYSIKAWDPLVESEPAGWDVAFDTTDTPLNGSLMLIVHKADATFGNITVERIWPYKVYLPLVLKE